MSRANEKTASVDAATAAESWGNDPKTGPTLQESLDALKGAGVAVPGASSVDRLGSEVLVALTNAGVRERQLANIRNDRKATAEEIFDAAGAFRISEADAQKAISRFMKAAADAEVGE